MPAVKPKGRILVASNVASDARMIERLLSTEYDDIVLSTERESAVGDFDQAQPQVVILAFRSIEKAEHFYLGLFRQSALVHSHPHCAVVLCGKDEVRRAYELCKSDCFDDYVLFWPVVHDAPRLLMATYLALRSLEREAREPSLSQFAVEAGRIQGLEANLDAYVTSGKDQIESATRTLRSAGKAIDDALDDFSHKIVSSDPKAIRREIERLKADRIAKSLNGVHCAIHPLQHWADSMKQSLAPQVESARTLGSLAARVCPFVLIIDDDEFQHRLIHKFLAEQPLELVFARSAAEAFYVVRKHRPDLILMDIGLPDVDGIEVTRKLKLSERLAKIPVIMITGTSQKEVVLNSKIAGASDYLVKPIERGNLIEKVTRTLGRTASKNPA